MMSMQNFNSQTRDGIDECYAVDTLQAYLDGWSDDAVSERIEHHVSQCQSCEETLVALEKESDTLVARLRENAANRSVASRSESAIVDALRRSSRIISEETQSIEGVSLPDQVGPYELIRPIGNGGMGTVYLAQHLELGKQVALKLVAVSSKRDDQRFERFLRETRAAGGLSHPSIVNATDAGRNGMIQYLAMEYIDGFDLGSISRRLGPLPIADACEVIRQTALAVAHAHGEGIIHRDIKPSNLMIDRAGNVKLLDFGLARITHWDDGAAELTSVGQLMGTLDYMSPEQAERPEAADYRADIYSLGATLFRLIVGRAPLAATPNLSPLAKLKLLADHDPPMLKALREDCSDDLSDYVSELLRRDPNCRPPSATHVAERLEPHCHEHSLPTLIRRAELADEHRPDSTNRLLREENLSIASDHTESPPTGRNFHWVTMVAVPLLLLAGVFITLDTMKGQLVIDSEVDDVSVQLLKDGKLYDDLKIITGPNTTKLFAGKYQVLIGEGSDGVIYGENFLTVTRGSTTITRIIAKPKTNESLNSQEKTTDPLQNIAPIPASNEPLQPGQKLRIMSLADKALEISATVMSDHTIKARMIGVVSVKGKNLAELKEELTKRYKKFYDDPAIEVFFDESQLLNAGLNAVDSAGDPITSIKSNPLNEPVFQNKKLSEWLSILKYEQSQPSVNEALVALTALSHSENIEQIKEVSLERLGRTSGSAGIAIMLLLHAKLSQEDFEKTYFDLLNSDEEQSRRHAINYLDRLTHDEKIFSSILDWVELRVFDQASDYPDWRAVANSLQHELRNKQSRLPNKLTARGVQLLKDATALGRIPPSYWLKRTWEMETPWEQDLQFNACVAVVKSENSDPTDFGTALWQLQKLMRTVMDRDLNPFHDREFVGSLQHRLVHYWNKSPSVQIVYVSDRANGSLACGEMFVPGFARNELKGISVAKINIPEWQKKVRCSSMKAEMGLPISIPLEIIDLMLTAGELGNAEDMIRRLDESTLSSYQLVERIFKDGNIAGMRVSWPDLRITDYVRSEPNTGKQVQVPTQKQWFEFFVHCRTSYLLDLAAEKIQNTENTEQRKNKEEN